MISNSTVWSHWGQIAHMNAMEFPMPQFIIRNLQVVLSFLMASTWSANSALAQHSHFYGHYGNHGYYSGHSGHVDHYYHQGHIDHIYHPTHIHNYGYYPSYSSPVYETVVVPQYVPQTIPYAPVVVNKPVISDPVIVTEPRVAANAPAATLQPMVGCDVEVITNTAKIKDGKLVLAVVPKGAVFTVSEVRGAWLKIDAGLPKQGWIFRRNVRVVEPSEEEAPPAE